jgi:hypothetical protein
LLPAAEPFHAVSRRFTPFHAVSRRFSPFHAVSRRFSPFHAVSRRFTPFHAVSRRFSPFLAVSRRFSPFLAVSRRFTPFLAPVHLTCPNASLCIMTPHRCPAHLTAAFHETGYIPIPNFLETLVRNQPLMNDKEYLDEDLHGNGACPFLFLSCSPTSSLS